MQLHHGGRLKQAAAQYRIPLCDWLDLSTGVSPWSWPVPAGMPHQAWQRLPDADAELARAACHYYGAQTALPVAGSQAAIRSLPWVRKQASGLGRVALPARGYREHRQAWERAGFDLCFYRDWPSDALIASCDVVVMIHPNNPTAQRFARAALLDLHQRLNERGSWLVVDEAFLDPAPEQSLAPDSHQPGLIVLRSVGKFFGLAGLRAGFVLAEPAILQALAEELGPWTLNGPASWLLPQMLADRDWQQQQCARLQQASTRLGALLACLLPEDTALAGTDLFQTARFKAAVLAPRYYEALAAQGILVRLLDEGDGLRFGLPADAAQYRRLERALTRIAAAPDQAASSSSNS